jgi:hypothetical protein
MLDKLKQKIPIKYFMLFYLGILFLYSSWNVRAFNIFIGLLILAIYSAGDILWTYLRDKTWYFSLSSLISGCILGLVGLPFNNLAIAIILPLLAVLGKQLLHFGKMRHVFNPASFAMLVVSLFIPIISWWGVAWGNQVFWIVLIAGIFILWRQSAWHKTLSFLVSYIITLAIIYLVSSHGVFDISNMFNISIFDGRLIFFSTVMLIEPITSTFPTLLQRMFYASLVGIIAAILLSFYIDSLIVGLLLSNLIASLLFL